MYSLAIYGAATFQQDAPKLGVKTLSGREIERDPLQARPPTLLHDSCPANTAAICMCKPQRLGTYCVGVTLAGLLTSAVFKMQSAEGWQNFTAGWAVGGLSGVAWGYILTQVNSSCCPTYTGRHESIGGILADSMTTERHTNFQLDVEE